MLAGSGGLSRKNVSFNGADAFAPFCDVQRLAQWIVDRVALKQGGMQPVNPLTSRPRLQRAGGLIADEIDARLGIHLLGNYRCQP